MESFELFLDKIKEADLNVHGIHFYQKGEEKEHFFHKDIDYPIYSATKTYLSAVLGIAQKEGYIAIEKPLANYIERDYYKMMPKQQRELFEQIPLKRFLTMSVCGLPFRLQGDDWYGFVSNLKIDYSAKPDFCYSNISAYLVGVATENAIGKPFMEYMKEKLLDPLELKAPEYMKDPYGHFYGASGMRLKLGDFSKFGNLYLHEGKVRDKSIIPIDWIKESSSIMTSCKEGGYGYFIWKYENGYRLSGKWGQRSIILPEQRIALTYLSDLQEVEHSKKMDDLVKTFLQAK